MSFPILRLSLYCIVFFCSYLTLKGQETYKIIADSVHTLIENESDDEKKLDLIFENAFYYDFAPFTYPLLQLADEISQRLDDHASIIETQISYGHYYNFSSKYDSSHVFFDRALALPYIDEHVGFKAELLEGKAVSYSRSDQIQDAINYFSQSLEILENPISRADYIEKEGEEDLQKMSSIIHNNVGNLYKRIEEYDEAINHYDQAIELMYALDAERYAATVIMNKANTYVELEYYDKALKTHLLAKKLKVKYDASPRTVAFSDLNIGICQGGLGDYDLALQSLDSAIAVFEDINNNKGLTYGYAERGIIYNALGQGEKAIAACEKSRDILEREGIVDYSNKVYDCLYRSHKSLQNFGASLANLENLKTVQDSALNSTNFRRIGQLESQLTYDKEQAISQLKLENQQKQNKMNIIGFAAILLGLGAITSLIYKNYKDKSKAERLLSEKNAVISKALSEKEVLLQEIHHRVKNNLQFVSSLLALQTDHVSDKKAVDALQEGQDRVQSMALIHQNLYHEDNLTGVDMSDYFHKLIRGLFDSYNIRRDQVTLRLDIEDINLDVDSVIPIGLIVNELVSNALKYAFPDKRKGTISVSLKELENRIVLTVQDNGIGLSEDLQTAMGGSFGYKLIEVFKDQLEGDLKIDGREGTKVQMIIKQYEVVS